MKKIFKFVSCVVSLAAIGFTGYTLYKKYVVKDQDETDDGFDDLFEDDSFKEGKSKREYVNVDIDK
ncbi:MAG: hypothetical protein MJ124_07185 [Lachnospiraceae bacterium]|nr:hypothetical protein [Lachnospiraceae bacterium]